MSRPDNGKRYREVGKALAGELCCSALLAFLPFPLSSLLSALAVWFFYSRLMLRGGFEGNWGRLKAFLLTLLVPVLVGLLLNKPDLAWGCLIVAIYWVRIWR